jgi:hypothetical protein
VTASIGVAYTPAGRPKPVSALISTADLNLYQAKESGRNCVVCLSGHPTLGPDGQLTSDGENAPTEEQDVEPCAPAHNFQAGWG